MASCKKVIVSQSWGTYAGGGGGGGGGGQVCAPNNTDAVRFPNFVEPCFRYFAGNDS